MLISPIYKKLQNVANPEKFFRKHFIAAALVSFVGAYSVSGALVWDSIQEEWNDKNFKATNLLPWNLAINHGKNAGLALEVSYIGDVSAAYAGLGILYWRRRRSKTDSPPRNTP